MVLVEVSRKPYLASIVPVIVNAILSEHQIIVDIVAFVNKGDFPRSRLGEKQRGKILAGWVTRKLRTLAQFGIRDLDAAALGEGGDGTDVNRASTGSVRSLSGAAVGTSSLRNMEHAPQILEQEEFTQQIDHIAGMRPVGTAMTNTDDQITPTGYHPGGTSTMSTYDRGNDYGFTGSYSADTANQRQDSFHHYGQAQTTSDVHPPNIEPKSAARHVSSQAPPQIRLPGVDGREAFELWGSTPDQEAEDWTTNAMMHMNLTGNAKQN